MQQLQNDSCQQIWGCVNKPFILYITSEVKQYFFITQTKDRGTMGRGRPLFSLPLPIFPRALSFSFSPASPKHKEASAEGTEGAHRGRKVSAPMATLNLGCLGACSPSRKIFKFGSGKCHLLCFLQDIFSKYSRRKIQ